MESMKEMEKLGYVKEKVHVLNRGFNFKQESTGKYIHFQNQRSSLPKKETPPAAEEANYVPGGIEIQGNLEEERLNPSLKNVIHNLMIMEDKLGFAYSGAYTVQRAKDTGRDWSNVLAIKLHGCACGKRDKFKGGYVLISQPIHITHGKSAQFGIKKDIELYCKHKTTKKIKKDLSNLSSGFHDHLRKHFWSEATRGRRVAKC